MYTSIYWLYMYKGHSPINFTKKINDPSYCRYLCNTVLIHLEKGIYKADTKQLMPVVHKNFPLWELIERELCTAFSGHIMGLGERDGWSVQESLVWLWVDIRKMNRSYICVMELKTTTSQRHSHVQRLWSRRKLDEFTELKIWGWTIERK